MAKQGFIYKGTDILNDKSYIGCHYGKNWNNRKNAHLRGDGNKDIADRVARYGKEVIRWECLRNGLTRDELGMWEDHLILQYGTLFPNGYNRTYGGELTSHSSETKKLISEKSKQNSKRGEDHYRYRKDLWDNKERIAKEYSGGRTSADLALEYDCDRSTICVIVKSQGIEVRDSQYERLDIWEDKEVIVKRYLNGESPIKLGKEYNCHETVILRMVRFCGYKINDPGRPKSKVWNHKENIVRKYLDGMDIGKLSIIYCCGTATIYRILKSGGIEFKRK